MKMLYNRSLIGGIAERGVDPTRIFFLGLSDVGVMLYRMLLRKPGIAKAAFAMLANLPKKLSKEDSSNYVPTPLAFLHGSKDWIHPHNGGLALPRFNRVLSIDDTAKFWASKNQVDQEPILTDLPDIDPGDGSDIQLREYATQGPGSAEVFSYLMRGAGHTIPVLDAPETSNRFLFDLLSGEKNRDVNVFDVALAIL